MTTKHYATKQEALDANKEGELVVKFNGSDTYFILSGKTVEQLVATKCPFALVNDDGIEVPVL